MEQPQRVCGARIALSSGLGFQFTRDVVVRWGEDDTLIDDGRRKNIESYTDDVDGRLAGGFWCWLMLSVYVDNNND